MGDDGHGASVAPGAARAMVLDEGQQCPIRSRTSSRSAPTAPGCTGTSAGRRIAGTTLTTRLYSILTRAGGDPARMRLVHPAITLSKPARHAVAMVIQQVCDHHDWTLHSSNVRSNHVHVVVSAPRTPEQVMVALKSWCTRRLRQQGLAQEDAKVWSRHGSTKYIWKPNQLVEACRYVVEAQDDDDGPDREK